MQAGGLWESSALGGNAFVFKAHKFRRLASSLIKVCSWCESKGEKKLGQHKKTNESLGSHFKLSLHYERNMACQRVAPFTVTKPSGKERSGQQREKTCSQVSLDLTTTSIFQ